MSPGLEGCLRPVFVLVAADGFAMKIFEVQQVKGRGKLRVSNSPSLIGPNTRDSPPEIYFVRFGERTTSERTQAASMDYLPTLGIVTVRLYGECLKSRVIGFIVSNLDRHRINAFVSSTP